MSEAAGISATEAWQRLEEGNQRFATGQMEHPHQDAQYLDSLIAGQQPIATIVNCADSRVRANLVFDQGMGDIFEVALAGEVMNEDALASVEYSVAHLGVRLVLVMGHGPKCGAVAAAVDLADGGEAHGNLKALLTKIVPAVEQVSGMEGDRLVNACQANARMVARQIAGDPQIGGAGTEVWPVYYDIETRRVTKLN